MGGAKNRRSTSIPSVDNRQTTTVTTLQSVTVLWPPTSGPATAMAIGLLESHCHQQACLHHTDTDSVTLLSRTLPGRILGSEIDGTHPDPSTQTHTPTPTPKQHARTHKQTSADARTHRHTAARTSSTASCTCAMSKSVLSARRAAALASCCARWSAVAMAASPVVMHCR
jgi:hypothetical protein